MSAIMVYAVSNGVCVNFFHSVGNGSLQQGLGNVPRAPFLCAGCHVTNCSGAMASIGPCPNHLFSLSYHHTDTSIVFYLETLLWRASEKYQAPSASISGAPSPI